MSGWIDAIVFWHWWVFAVVLLLIEVLAPSTLLLWPAIAAGLVGTLLFLVPTLDWHQQWLVFALVTVVSAVLGRAYLRRRPILSDRPQLNRRGEQYIGRVLTLQDPIVNGVGRIRVDDTQWRVQGQDLPARARVKVVGVDGSTLQVEPAG